MFISTCEHLVSTPKCPSGVHLVGRDLAQGYWGNSNGLLVGFRSCFNSPKTERVIISLTPTSQLSSQLDRSSFEKKQLCLIDEM